MKHRDKQERRMQMKIARGERRHKRKKHKGKK